MCLTRNQRPYGQTLHSCHKQLEDKMMCGTEACRDQDWAQATASSDLVGSGSQWATS